MSLKFIKKKETENYSGLFIILLLVYKKICYISPIYNKIKY